MEKLKIGIIGCGGIANQKHFPTLSKLTDEVELVSFCDLIIERAKKGAEQYGAEGAKVCTDYKELLDDESIDVAYVLTPNREHCEITVAALEKGKHVLCEKPMAASYADAKKMLDAVKKSGKKLTIGYQNRFRPDSLYMKRACERGDLGEIYYAKASSVRRRGVPTWGVFLDAEAQGGGPLIDIGTHSLDLTLWMMDNYNVKSVTGNVYRKLADQVPETGNAFGDWDPKEFTVEDSAFGFVTMQDGATVQVEASWALNRLAPPGMITTLCGTKAGADMDAGLRFNFVEFGKLATRIPSLTGEGVDFFDASDVPQPEDLEARAWLNAIKKDKDPVVKPEQAIVVTQILEAIYESAKTGKMIYFD